MLRFATLCFLGWLLVWQRPVQAQAPSYEWEIAKHQRWEAHKNKLTDSLLLIHRKRLLFSLGYGNYVIPGFEGAEADSNGINIRDGHRVFTVSVARFMTNRLAIELDWNLYLIKQNMAIIGSSIRGGGGVVSTVLIQTKYLFPVLANRPVGSIRSFSPFQLTTKLSGIAFGGFGRMRRNLRYE